MRWNVLAKGIAKYDFISVTFERLNVINSNIKKTQSSVRSNVLIWVLNMWSLPKQSIWPISRELEIMNLFVSLINNIQRGNMVVTIIQANYPEMRSQSHILNESFILYLRRVFFFFFIFLFLATSKGMWDLSSLVRDQTSASCSGGMES